jgi:hypothetical protein
LQRKFIFNVAATVKILNIETFVFSRTVSHFMEENICFQLVSVICGLEPGGGLQNIRLRHLQQQQCQYIDFL